MQTYVLTYARTYIHTYIHLRTCIHKVLHNMPIGSSLYDEEGAKLVPEIMAEAAKQRVQITLPVDFITAQKFGEAGPDNKTAPATKETGVAKGMMGLDCGPESNKINTAVVLSSKTIIWNGPMGRHCEGYKPHPHPSLLTLHLPFSPSPPSPTPHLSPLTSHPHPYPHPHPHPHPQPQPQPHPHPSLTQTQMSLRLSLLTNLTG